MPDPRLLAAVHEAGHVVVAIRMGGIVREVSIGDTGGGCTREAFSASLGEDEIARRRFVISIAGGIAEQRLAGGSRLYSSTDMRRTRDLPLDDRERADLVGVAERIVAEHWSSIFRLARTLARVGKLDEREIMGVLTVARGDRNGLLRRGDRAAA